MRTITVQPGQAIQLGRQYENEITQVVFPNNIVSRFLNAAGDPGIFGIWIHRPGDPVGYPIGSPLVSYADGQVSWLITSTELAKAGTAQVQLRYIVDNIQVMSMVYKAVISDSVEIGEDVPEPMEPWADAIMEALEDIHEVPAGGTTGQVLAKASDDDYDLEWTDQSGGGGGGAVSPYTSNPAALGTASPGSSDDYSRGDHVHQKPSAADIGAIAAPESPSNGQYLKWNGSAWVPAAAPVTSVNGSTGAVTLTIPATAGDVGAIAAPESPATGAFLVWSGSAWIAQTLSVWQASSY